MSKRCDKGFKEFAKVTIIREKRGIEKETKSARRVDEISISMLLKRDRSFPVVGCWTLVLMIQDDGSLGAEQNPSGGRRYSSY